MTQPVRARQYVAGPSFTPRPYGLLSALGDVVRNPGDPHWQAGANYETLCALSTTTFDACYAVSGVGDIAAVALPPPKAATADMEMRGATAFTVMAEVDCSTPGFWDRAEEMGEQALAQSEQYQVERALWTGIAGGVTTVFPHLASNVTIREAVTGILLQQAATVVTGGGATLDVVEGLGRLEQGLADCYSGVGVIHVPAILGPALAEAHLLEREGPRYRTPNGNIVVLGGGYTGSGPDGTTPTGSRWMYATGAMMIYRGAVMIPRGRESIDRLTNTVRTIAERTYVIGWDCCLIATSVSIGGTVSGTSGSAT